MPGGSETAAAVIVAEVGDAMSMFPRAGHLVAWGGVCPRLDDSAGQRRSTRTRQGAPWLKTTLGQRAWAATRKKHRYVHAQFLRLNSRRGPKKASLAVAASMLTGVDHLRRDASNSTTAATSTSCNMTNPGSPTGSANACATSGWKSR